MDTVNGEVMIAGEKLPPFPIDRLAPLGHPLLGKGDELCASLRTENSLDLGVINEEEDGLMGCGDLSPSTSMLSSSLLEPPNWITLVA